MVTYQKPVLSKEQGILMILRGLIVKLYEGNEFRSYRNRGEMERGILMKKIASKKTNIGQCLAFFLMTVGISWAFWIPAAAASVENRFLMVMGTYGPAISAILLSVFTGGRAGLKKLFAGFLIWRVNVRWYLFSFFGTAVLVLIAIWIHTVTGDAFLVFNDPKQWYLTVPVFGYVLLFSVLGEEIGWRGYALPRLQTNCNALVSSLIIGVVWGLWHLPLFFASWNFHSGIPLALFLVQDIALAVVFTWIYNGTGGSLLVVNLFHAASNTTLGILPVLPGDAGGSMVPLRITVVLLCVVSSLIIILNRPTALIRSGRKVLHESD